MQEFILANKYFREKKYKESIELYTECINKSSFYIYYQNRGYAYYKLHDIYHAIKDLSNAYLININATISYNLIKNIELDKKKYLLSVIVPIFNSEKYIKQCVYSILQQSLKNIEIILINDGSTDRSLYIIKQLQEKHENIKIIDNKIPSGNPGTPRNQGIKIAQGKYIGFVDSDDWIEKDYYKNLINIALLC